MNANPSDHLFMGNHRAHYTRSGWALFEQGASLNLPLGPVRRGKVIRFLIKIMASSLSDLTIWRSFQLIKCHLEDNFNYSSKSAWLFQFLTRFSLSPTGC